MVRIDSPRISRNTQRGLWPQPKPENRNHRRRGRTAGLAAMPVNDIRRIRVIRGFLF